MTSGANPSGVVLFTDEQMGALYTFVAQQVSRKRATVVATNDLLQRVLRYLARVSDNGNMHDAAARQQTLVHLLERCPLRPVEASSLLPKVENAGFYRAAVVLHKQVIAGFAWLCFCCLVADRCSLLCTCFVSHPHTQAGDFPKVLASYIRDPDPAFSKQVFAYLESEIRKVIRGGDGDEVASLNSVGEPSNEEYLLVRNITCSCVCVCSCARAVQVAFDSWLVAVWACWNRLERNT